MRFARSAVCIVMCCASLPVLAGLGTFDGTSEESWVADRTSIVIAKIESIQLAAPDAVGGLKLTLLPQATIAGAFDCSARPRIVADCWFATGGNSAIFPDHRPRPGTLGLALICMYESEDFYRVPNEICPLLPDQQPLCPIKGPDDPAVAQTLAKAQKARAIAKQKQAEQRKQNKRGRE